MSLDHINVAEVFLLLAGVGLLMWLFSAYVVYRTERAIMMAHLELAAAHKTFLRNDYARVAAESQIYHQELSGLITEVQDITTVFKDVVTSDTWDGESHLRRLQRMERELADVRGPGATSAG